MSRLHIAPCHLPLGSYRIAGVFALRFSSSSTASKQEQQQQQHHQTQLIICARRFNILGSECVGWILRICVVT